MLIFRKQARHNEFEMYDLMVAAAAERHAKHTHVIVDTWPKLTDMKENVILGSFSWLGMSSHTRWIKRATSIAVGEYIATPGDVARDYLKIKYPNRRRISYEQRGEIMRHRSQPLYALPAYIPDATYLDIKSAYWSIMSIVGWDVDYFPGRWIGIGEAMDDFPFAGHKLARNCLVTSGLNSAASIWMYEKQKPVARNFGNTFINFQLWALVQDILNGIALELYNEDIIYYANTDGFILNTKDRTAAASIISAWGLPARDKKRGRCSVFGAGKYRFGDNENAEQAPGNHTRLFGIHDVPNARWLRARLNDLSELAQPALGWEN
ncbi:MAG: hypothetical protein WC734_06200 [Patescibacteria group bacterium]|jgi:hypothetical protein